LRCRYLLKRIYTFEIIISNVQTPLKWVLEFRYLFMRIQTSKIIISMITISKINKSLRYKGLFKRILTFEKIILEVHIHLKMSTWCLNMYSRP
jgi:hypothetical protein